MRIDPFFLTVLVVGVCPPSLLPIKGLPFTNLREDRDEDTIGDNALWLEKKDGTDSSCLIARYGDNVFPRVGRYILRPKKILSNEGKNSN